ncbi:MAG TPA: hypothetical protein VN229_09545 [Terriglobales bacterium]|nr:hypothetical protein [Terriglobales bacterium]
MPAKVRAVSTAGKAWRMVTEVSRTQPKLVLSAFLLCALSYIPYYLTWLNLGPVATLNDIVTGYGRWIIDLIQGIVCLPLTNAVCRRVLLSEHADQPIWESAVWRNRAFWAIAAAIFIVKLVTTEMTGDSGSALLHHVIPSDAVVILMQWLFWLIGLILGLALWLVVPAAAVHAKTSRMQSAFLGLRGQFWRLWFTWFLATSPLWLPSYVLAFATDQKANPEITFIIISSLWTQLISFALVIVGATVMSIFYQATSEEALGQRR